MRHRRQTDRPQSGEMARRAAEQPVVAEAAQEVGMIVVEGETEAQLLEPG
jgi:hypothetical protein